MALEHQDWKLATSLVVLVTSSAALEASSVEQAANLATLVVMAALAAEHSFDSKN